MRHVLVPNCLIARQWFAGDRSQPEGHPQLSCRLTLAVSALTALLHLASGLSLSDSYTRCTAVYKVIVFLFRLVRFLTALGQLQSHP